MKTREKGDAGMAPARRRKKFKRRTPSHSRRQWLLANHGRVSVRAKDAPIARRQLPQRTHAKGLRLRERALNGLSRFWGALGAGLLTSPKPPTAGLQDS